MSEAIVTYRVEATGLFAPRYVVTQDSAPVGVLSVRRGRFGMVVGGTWRPEKGEVMEIRRDPGLLRSQFSVWTEGKEWLGSSLRWSFFRRQIDLWTGGRPYRMVPLPGFGRGWRLVASKTGEAARIEHGLLSRSATITVFRKTELELILFAHFLGAMTLTESLLPTSLDAARRSGPQAPQASKA
jgi:hypothetical protein